MEELKKKVEALLFSSGRSMSAFEIMKLLRINGLEELKNAIKDLKVDYDNRDSSLILIDEGDRWKITTKEDYFNVVRKIVTETELPKSLMETLAVIAWKYPLKQCDLIKVRTNKAYDHLNQLEQSGYISRQKHGRTKLIKLTDKFFAYFDLPPEKLKEKFSDFNQIAHAISSKEGEIVAMKEAHKKQVEEAKKMQEQHEEKQKDEIKKAETEIDLLDEKNKKVKLETYKTEQSLDPAEETKLGLETYDSEVKDRDNAKKQEETEELKEKSEDAESDDANKEKPIEEETQDDSIDKEKSIENSE